ncbi:MAG: tripartite tricarboxylate transporter TctB family protein [Alkalilacustris sp.]
MPLAVTERALTTLALLLVGIALLASTFEAGIARPERAFSPSFFPQIVLGMWCALALAGLVADVRAGPAGAPPSAPGGLWRAAALAVGLLAVAWLMPKLGFALTAAGFCAVALPLFGVRHPVAVAAYALAVPGALVGVFNHLLRMPLPTSPFTHLF